MYTASLHFIYLPSRTKVHRSLRKVSESPQSPTAHTYHPQTHISTTNQTINLQPSMKRLPKFDALGDSIVKADGPTCQERLLNFSNVKRNLATSEFS